MTTHNTPQTFSKPETPVKSVSESTKAVTPIQPTTVDDKDGWDSF